MGTLIKVLREDGDADTPPTIDYTFDALDFSISEDITPRAGNDTSGSVGSFSFTIAQPDPAVHHPAGSPAAQICKYGPGFFQGRRVVFDNPLFGTHTGKILVPSYTGDGKVQFDCVSKTEVLNAYNVKAGPYVGTLGGAIRYYVSLADPTTFVDVDSSLANRPVALPGWFGELWFQIKKLAVAHGAEFQLVGSQYVFREVQQETASAGRNVRISPSVTLPNLARSVEIYNYRNRPITNQLVYPPGGWNEAEQPRIINVNAGEWAEETIELSASVSSIQAPEMRESVPPEYSSSSVYTVIGNDDFPVSPKMWEDKGGRMTITINPDTRSLTIRVKGAQGVPNANGGECTNFAIALSAAGGSRYSTLRLVGTGVAFDKELIKVRTCVPDNQTATEVGETIDNEFISDRDQAYAAGVRAAVNYAGPVPAISSQVTNLLGTEPQVLGKVAGTRIYDPLTRIPYRIRSARVSPGGIEVSSAEEDMAHYDIEDSEKDNTYAQAEENRRGLTYDQDRLTGFKSG